MIRVGNPVPISLQLVDGDEKQKVLAQVYTPNGTKIFEQPCEHTEGGSYDNTSFTMPPVQWIKVRFEVEGDKYEITTEKFFSNEPEPKKHIPVYGVVTKISDLDLGYAVGVANEI